MSEIIKVLALVLLAAVVTPLQAEAQQPRQGAQQAAEEARPPGEAAAKLTLVYEREVYTYRGGNRRDPFRPLTAEEDMGPRFETLSLQGIIYATGQGNSVALITDGTGRVYRVRVGDMVGNSRVIEIGPARVVLAVEHFGTIRQEILELPTQRGTDR